MCSVRPIQSPFLAVDSLAFSPMSSPELDTMSQKGHSHHSLEMELGSEASGGRAEFRPYVLCFFAHLCVLCHCVSHVVPTFPACSVGIRLESTSLGHPLVSVDKSIYYMCGVVSCVSEAQFSRWKNYKKGWDLAWRAAQKRPGFQPCNTATVTFPLGLILRWAP